MKLQGLIIDRFGIYQDVRLDGLDHGLNLFLGDNEAGKSTLAAFIHVMFFGMPQARSARLQAVRRHWQGGTLMLYTPEGVLALQRRRGPRGGPVTITFPDGSSGGEAELQALLGLDPVLYRDLYGFGLDELQSMDTLTGDEVQDLLWGAFLGGSHAANLPRARKRLEQRRKELYLPGGSKPLVNRLHQELCAIAGKLVEAHKGLEEYERLQARLPAMERDYRRSERELADAVRERERLQTWCGLWDHWVAYQEALRGLEQSPPELEKFPADGRERLRSLQGEVRGLERKREETRARLEQERIDTAILGLQPAIAALSGRRQSYADDRARVAELASAVDAGEARLQGWSPTPEQVRELELRLPRLRRSVVELEVARHARDDRQRLAESLQTRAHAGALAGRRRRNLLLAAGAAFTAALIAGAGLGLSVGALAGVVAGGALLLPAAMLLALGLRFAAFPVPAGEIEDAVRECAQQQRAVERAHARVRELAAGLPVGGEEVDAETVEELQRRLLDAGRLLEQRARLRQARNRLAGFEQDLAALLRDLQRDVPADVDALVLLQGLEEELRQNSQALARRKSMAQQLEDLEAAIRQGRARIAALVAAGGAGDESDFLRRAELREQRRKLLEARETHARELLSRARADDLEKLCSRLAGLTRPRLQEQLLEARARENSCQERRDELLRGRVQMEERCRQLRQSDNVGKLRARWEATNTRVREAAREWATHAVARRLLDLGKERFEERHQPEVIARASAFFAIITGGAYQRVVIPPDAPDTFKVVAADGTQRPARELSRGTAEQLYLCLRLGYIAGRGAAGDLPVIMDDVLVNFDPRRAARTAGVLLRLAAERQVLLFTCHPETAALLRGQRPGIPLFRVAGGTITRDIGGAD